MSNSLIRMAVLELQTIDNKEVVKVAGLVRRLKNWYKKRTNPEYKTIVDSLQKDTVEMQQTLGELNNELNLLQSAIKDGEIEEYHSRLNNVKELSSKLWAGLKQTSGDSKDYYTLQSMEEPGFNEWFKKFIPKEYDLEFGKNYNLPLKEIKWYSNLDPESISIRQGGALEVLLRLVREALVRDGFATNEDVDKMFKNTQPFIKEFQNAIVNGTLVKADIKKPNKAITKVMGGSTEIEVTTAPFFIPGTKIKMQALTTLIDLGTTKSSRNKLSLRKTNYVTILGNKFSERYDELKKIALRSQQELPYKVTKLSEVQFADVLRKGYQKAFGTDPTAEALAGGWAQCILESGRPINLPNNNVGNIKATPDWVSSGKQYFVKSTAEYTSDGKPFQHTDAQWRAYPTPEDGAAGYWLLIGKRYKPAMAWMAAGDPESATVALAMNRYFTANIQKYSKGVGSLYNEFMTKIAPQLPGLKSMPASPPGQKLAVKPWVSQYSKSEKDAIVGGGSPSQDSSSLSNNDIDSLINTLYADVGPLDKFVKQAILNEILPTSKLLIVIKGDNLEFSDKTEYARVSSYVLNKFLDACTSVHTDGKNIEIQCSIKGSPITTSRAVQAICDCVSDGLKIQKNKKITSMVVPGLFSKFSEMKMKTLYRNERILNLKTFEE